MTQSRSPSISVVIPAFNAGEGISITLNSVLCQDVTPDEIIVVDDGSTDDTKDRVRKFGNKVLLVSQKNQGAASARHTGVLSATSDIVVFCDAGDYARPGKLRLIKDAFTQFPDAVASFGAQWNKAKEQQPKLADWVKWPLDGKFHLIKDPFSLQLSIPGPLARVMDMGIKKDIALQSTNISNFYTGANDYVVQLKTAAYGPFVYIASVTTDFEFLPGGISKTLGLPIQQGFSLCGAAEVCEHFNRPADDFVILRKRVIEGLPQAFLSAYQKHKWPLLRRLLHIQWRYGSTRKFIRRFWWALDNTQQKGDLKNFRVLYYIGFFLKYTYKKYLIVFKNFNFLKTKK